MLQQWGIISSSAQEIPWTQPVLSSNGVLGGSSFACVSNDTYSGREAWRAFDGISNTGWNSTTAASTANPTWLTFYNSIPLKVTKLDLYNWANYYIVDYSIVASNDNSSWTTLTTGTFPNAGNYGLNTVNLSNNNSFYNYYKIICTNDNGAATAISTLNITAVQQIAVTNSIIFPTSYSNTGYGFSLGFIDENNTAYCTNKTISGMSLYNPSSNNGYANWYTIGY